MVESSPSRQRRPPCKTNKGMLDEAAFVAALTYLLSQPSCASLQCHPWEICCTCRPFGAALACGAYHMSHGSVG